MRAIDVEQHRLDAHAGAHNATCTCDRFGDDPSEVIAADAKERDRFGIGPEGRRQNRA
jgi:hypothetical protein